MTEELEDWNELQASLEKKCAAAGVPYKHPTNQARNIYLFEAMTGEFVEPSVRRSVEEDPVVRLSFWSNKFLEYKSSVLNTELVSWLVDRVNEARRGE